MTSSSSSAPVTVKPNYTMGEGGHEKGINCIDFYGGSDRPFLVTGSDDQTVRVWDYHTKSCVRVLEGHTSNVSAVIFHPQLPFLLSAGEDSTLRIWNAQTFRPEASYNFGMDRAWGLACCRAHNAIGIAFDSGSVVFQLGKGDPCASLDSIQGRLVWSRARGSGSAGSHGNEILTGLVRLLDVEGRPIRVPADSEIIPLTPKELGTSDVFPQNLQHSPDGRLVAVWGDGEYVIYSTIGWRNRAFGRGTEIAWAAPGGDVFGIRDVNGRVIINRVSAHDQGVPVPGVMDCDKIFGGPLLGMSTGGSTLTFFDWSGQHLIRTIDVAAVSVSWSPDASHVAIQTDSSCYILAAKAAVLRSPQSFPCGEEGIEDSLELIDELEHSLKSVCWISGNCFVYLTEENRLAYHVVGGDADESFQLALFDRSHFLLGFIPSEKRVYLTDQDLQVTSYAIMPSLITFQSSVLAGGKLDLGLLKSIPSTYYARLAVFLQRRGYLREALEISPDTQFQFNLAIQLGDLQLARELLTTKMTEEQEKWQELGRVALKAWNLPVAEEALSRAGDLSSLFLLYAAAGDTDGLNSVAREAAKKPDHINLAFAAYVKAGSFVSAFELLLFEGRSAEAALFARTYGLSAENVSKAVEGWKRKLKLNANKGKGKENDRVAESLADPIANSELFNDVRFGLASAAAPLSSCARGRSVSFDGNVSVAGSNSTISLKQPEEENLPSTTTESGSGPTDTLSDDQMSLEVNTAGTGTRLEDLDEEDLNEVDADFGEPEFESSIIEGKSGILFEEVAEYPEIISTLPISNDPDPLLEELENMHIEGEYNEAVLTVIEDGADVYDIVEAEYPVDNEHVGNGEYPIHDVPTEEGQDSHYYPLTEDPTELKEQEYPTIDASHEEEATEYYPTDTFDHQQGYQGDYGQGYEGYGYNGYEGYKEYDDDETAAYDDALAYDEATAHNETTLYDEAYNCITENTLTTENENHLNYADASIKDSYDYFSSHDAPEEFDHFAEDNLVKKEESKVDEDEEIDFGGDGEVDAWL